MVSKVPAHPSLGVRWRHWRAPVMFAACVLVLVLVLAFAGVIAFRPGQGREPARSAAAVGPTAMATTGPTATPEAGAIIFPTTGAIIFPTNGFAPEPGGPVDVHFYAQSAAAVNGQPVGTTMPTVGFPVATAPQGTTTISETLTNVFNQAIGLVKADDQWHANEMMIYSDTGNATRDINGTPVITLTMSPPYPNYGQATLTLAKGATLTETTTWNGADSGGNPLPTGPAHPYWVVGPGYGITGAGAKGGPEFIFGGPTFELIIE